MIKRSLRLRSVRIEGIGYILTYQISHLIFSILIHCQAAVVPFIFSLKVIQLKSLSCFINDRWVKFRGNIKISFPCDLWLGYSFDNITVDSEIISLDDIVFRDFLCWGNSHTATLELWDEWRCWVDLHSLLEADFISYSFNCTCINPTMIPFNCIRYGVGLSILVLQKNKLNQVIHPCRRLKQCKIEGNWNNTKLPTVLQTLCLTNIRNPSKSVILN